MSGNANHRSLDLQGDGERLKNGTIRTTSQKLIAPPRSGAFVARDNPPNTQFRRFYERGDLPVAVEHKAVKNVISWKVRHDLCLCVRRNILLSCGH